MVFVALAIVFLFAHRAVTLARHERDAERIAKKQRVRLTIGLLTLASFIVMITFFLINMRVNR